MNADVIRQQVSIPKSAVPSNPIIRRDQIATDRNPAERFALVSGNDDPTVPEPTNAVAAVMPVRLKQLEPLKWSAQS